MKVFVFFVTYGAGNFQLCKDELSSFVNRVFPAGDIIPYYMDNKVSVEYSRFEVKFLPGDNRIREFTAWDKMVAIASKDHDINDSDVFLFVNDTFATNCGSEYLKFFKPCEEYNEPVAVGYVENFPKSVLINGVEHKEWIRSNLFYMSFSAYRQCSPFPFPLSKAEVFSEDILEFWSKTPL
ncbi:MAG: hypothetical protein HRU20_31320, partial [Pseudomonadales bacterium]|nr:hypothetical protein [Pseudomonadales bacterium]